MKLVREFERMDAFCGFFAALLEVFGENQRGSGIFSVEMRTFSSQLSTISWEKIYFGPPLWLSPLGVYQIIPKQPGYIPGQVRFLIRAKVIA